MRERGIAPVIVRVCAVFSLALALNACALNRNIDVTRTYTVSHPTTMSKAKKVQWAKVTRGFSIADYDSIYVAEVTLEGGAKASPLGTALAHDLRERVLRELGKKFPVTADEAAITGEGRYATLRMALGDIKSGNGFVRWFIGTGIASTVLQVEGSITEAGADTPVVEFVRHRSFDGYPWMGLNVTLFSAKSTHRSSMKEIARDIAAFLGKAGSE